MLKKGSSALKRSWMYRYINKVGAIFVTGAIIFIYEAKRCGKNMVLEYDESMIRCSVNQ